MPRSRKTPALAAGMVTALTALLLLPAAPASAGAATEPLELELALACEEDPAGVVIINNTMDELPDVDVTVTDVLTGETTDPVPVPEPVPAEDDVTFVFDDAEFDDVSLEDALVTVTADDPNSADEEDVFTAEIVFNCDPEVINGITAEAVCADPDDTSSLHNIVITNERPTAVTVDVNATTNGTTTTVSPDLTIGPEDDETVNLAATTRLVEITESDRDSGTITVNFEEECAAGGTTTTTTTTTTTPGSTTTTTRSGAAAGGGDDLANTGSGNGIMAGYGTTLLVIGGIILATNGWWRRWWTERDTLVADFNSWRRRDH